MNDALLSQVAWIGDKYVSGPIRGVILRFPGLGATGTVGGADPMELEWGQAGGLVVTPYQDPWGWMNPATRAFVDELVSGIFARYDLSADTPVIATGGSMGGHGALLYTLLSARPVAACAANCPVCDLQFHYTERPDLPKTMHHAFGSYGDISEALVAHSPLHQAGQDAGRAVPDYPRRRGPGGRQGAAFGQAGGGDCKSRGLNVDYREQAGMGHCGPFDWALQRRMTEFVLGQLGLRSSIMLVELAIGVAYGAGSS